ncbi:DUF5675 family protein [Dasania sp. GY-MA-18]|uniref:DUF5675 family protein n=1 Tax=Dasania phycosphaerae TaxID=2950436 RepID=A0A9J6RL72_9GAMM|nr:MULTISPECIES: DUF5675 family protein [Dasania]MCR8922651.1 DUF5675 family protein [Dasania sp. GY-MA-18]MCZ0865081.1 DUF5675 family protein [Dasania phycosphaerae]MCZ0868807.1 DUF5675 family protein [Dasania phycosphaerae]
MIITQLRSYPPNYTESRLFINGGKRFCWVLEDKKQPFGIKVPGQTCIPEGAYNVSITRSTRWQKDMLLLHNQDDLSIVRDGVRFTGVRPHGGNDVDDTAGCPLCAYHSNHQGKVWGRASDDLFKLVKRALDKGEEVLWVISS